MDLNGRIAKNFSHMSWRRHRAGLGAHLTFRDFLRSAPKSPHITEADCSKDMQR